jgi:hypothetical protein
MNDVANEIDWKAKGRDVANQAYAVYLGYKQNSDISLEETLADIHSVASKAETRDAAYRIFAKADCKEITQEIKDKEWSVQNIVLWAYMHLEKNDGHAGRSGKAQPLADVYREGDADGRPRRARLGSRRGGIQSAAPGGFTGK